MNKSITVSPYPDRNAYFMGVGISDSCSSCHADSKKLRYKIRIKDRDGVHGDNSFILCENCLNELYEQIKSLIENAE